MIRFSGDPANTAGPLRIAAVTAQVSTLRRALLDWEDAGFAVY
jgi:hypothetical protein